MKKGIIALLTICLAATNATAVEVPQLANVRARNITSLNGEWNYIIDVQEEGYYDYRMNPTAWGFFRNAKPQRPEDLIEYDFDKAAVMNIPGDWNTQNEQLFFYEGTVWFKRSFEWHRKADDHRTILYFGAVNYEARVWVNGRNAGYHVGGFTPFNMDITDLLTDGDNFVIVKVDNKRKAENVPTQIFDWWNYGGITRDVLLIDVAPVYIENYKLCLDKSAPDQISFNVNLNEKLAQCGDKWGRRFLKLFIVGLYWGCMVFVYFHLACGTLIHTYNVIFEAVGGDTERAVTAWNRAYLVQAVPYWASFVVLELTTTVGWFAIIWKGVLPLKKRWVLAAPMLVAGIGFLLELILPLPFNGFASGFESLGWIVMFLGGIQAIKNDDKEAD